MIITWVIYSNSLFNILIKDLNLKPYALGLHLVISEVGTGMLRVINNRSKRKGEAIEYRLKI